MRVIIVLALIACVVLARPAPVTKPVKVIPSSVPTTPRPKEIEVACTFQGDPHVRSPFNAFDFFDSGDYLFANFDNKVKIIGRTNTVPAYGKQAVTTAVMVIASHHGKQVKVSVHAKDRSLQVDHKPTTLANKKSIENKAVGIRVTHDSQEVYIVTVGTIRVLLSFKGAGANSYVDVSIFSSKSAADRVTGLCGKKKLIQKDDQAFVSKRTHYNPLPNPKRYRREDAERFCARLPTAIARHFCISDYLLGGEDLAKSSYTIETEKKHFRDFYRLPKKCRQAIRRHKFLINSGRHAEAHAFKKFVEHACAKKRVSKKCRYFKHTYAKYAHNFNKSAPRLSVAQRTQGANQLRLLGEKVQLACSKRARVACRQGRQTAVARLNKEIAEQQAKLNKLHAELQAAKARKCHV